MPLRLYLLGGVAVDGDGTLVDERELPGRQGRLALAYLVLQRRRRVPVDELAEAIWPDGAPRSRDTALRALVSKLRAPLGRVGLDPAGALRAQAGSYQLRLPADAWVDVEAAARSVEEAEGALRAGAAPRAWSSAMVAGAIARRPLLPADDTPWLVPARERVHDLLLRALDCLAEAALASGDAGLAGQVSSEAVELQPFRERSHRNLIRARAAAGDAAGAVRAYARCRSLLADELGIDPSPETEAAYLDILQPGRR